jgi:hypothetical protein
LPIGLLPMKASSHSTTSACCDGLPAFRCICLPNLKRYFWRA